MEFSRILNAYLLQTFKVLTHLRVKLVGKQVTVFTIDDILLPVDEPVGDLELARVLHDGDDSLELIRVELTSTRDRAIHEQSQLTVRDGNRKLLGSDSLPILRSHLATSPSRDFPLNASPRSLCLSQIFVPAKRRVDCCCLPLGKVDISLLANDVSVTTTNTLDLSQGVLYDIYP